MDRFVDEFIAEANIRAAEYNSVIDVRVVSRRRVVSVRVCVAV
jgi:hypothetical protein